MHTILTQLRHIALRSHVGIHIQIHSGGNGNGATCRQIGSKQQIISHTRSHLGHSIGRSRSYEIEVGPLAQLDV